MCSPRRVKLCFPQQARLMLGSLDTQNAHLLPPNYSACVTGYTNKNIAHAMTFEMVRSKVSSMISTIAYYAASNAAAINFDMSRLALDLLISTSKKTVTPSIVDKINSNKLSDELIQDFSFPNKNLQNIGEEFEIKWDAWDRILARKVCNSISFIVFFCWNEIKPKKI